MPSFLPSLLPWVAGSGKEHDGVDQLHLNQFGPCLWWASAEKGDKMGWEVSELGGVRWFLEATRERRSFQNETGERPAISLPVRRKKHSGLSLYSKHLNALS